MPDPTAPATETPNSRVAIAESPDARAARIRAAVLAAFLRGVANRRGKETAVAFALDRIAAANDGRERADAVAGTRAAFMMLGWRPLTEKTVARACRPARPSSTATAPGMSSTHDPEAV